MVAIRVSIEVEVNGGYDELVDGLDDMVQRGILVDYEYIDSFPYIRPPVEYNIMILEVDEPEDIDPMLDALNDIPAVLDWEVLDGE